MHCSCNGYAKRFIRTLKGGLADERGSPRSPATGALLGSASSCTAAPSRGASRSLAPGRDRACRTCASPRHRRAPSTRSDPPAWRPRPGLSRVMVDRQERPYLAVVSRVGHGGVGAPELGRSRRDDRPVVRPGLSPAAGALRSKQGGFSHEPEHQLSSDPISCSRRRRAVTDLAVALARKRRGLLA